MDLKEEEKLIKRAKAIRQRTDGGENKPFGRLYSSYHPKIRNYFLSRTGDERKAEDLTSKTFEKALIGLDSFQWQGVPFSAWLFRIAKNTFYDTLRSEKAKPKVSLEKLPPIKGAEGRPEEVALELSDQEFVERLLLKLPKRERDIIYLKFYKGRTNRAIAKLTGLSETNVGTILYRTLRKLRQELDH
jgi:RNA polymerase sigma factor (sigma-70 family)